MEMFSLPFGPSKELPGMPSGFEGVKSDVIAGDPPLTVFAAL